MPIIVSLFARARTAVTAIRNRRSQRTQMQTEREQRRLERMQIRLERRISRRYFAAVNQLSAFASTVTPVDTGALRESISLSPGEVSVNFGLFHPGITRPITLGGVIGWHTPYARFVNNGTRYQAAQRYAQTVSFEWKVIARATTANPWSYVSA